LHEAFEAVTGLLFRRVLPAPDDQNRGEAGGMSAVAVTFFEDLVARTKREVSLPVEEIAGLVRNTTAAEKSALPLLKLARPVSATCRTSRPTADRCGATLTC
jgi:hypothetical protein